MIKAIIFDMDGLMIDSEPFHLQAINIVINKLGYHLYRKDCKEYIGLSDKDTFQKIIKRFNLSIAVKELVNQKNIAYRKILKKHVHP